MKLILYLMPHAVIVSTPTSFSHTPSLTSFPIHSSVTFTFLFPFYLSLSTFFSHLVSLSHLLHSCFLTTSFYFPLSHPPSICPAAPWWYELMCQLSWSFPPAAVCQLQLSFPHVSLSLLLSSPQPLLVTLTASLLSAIFHSMMSAALSFALIPSVRLRSHHLFYFPLRQACQEDSTTCPQAV